MQQVTLALPELLWALRLPPVRAGAVFLWFLFLCLACGAQPAPEQGAGSIVSIFVHREASSRQSRAEVKETFTDVSLCQRFSDLWKDLQSTKEKPKGALSALPICTITVIWADQTESSFYKLSEKHLLSDGYLYTLTPGQADFLGSLCSGKPPTSE